MRTKNKQDVETRYSKIYDQYKSLKKDFNSLVTIGSNDIKNIDNDFIKELNWKFEVLTDFYIKNKDNFRDETMKVLDAELHTSEEGSAKAVIVNMIQIANRPDQKSTTASNIMKESLRERVGSYTTDYVKIDFVTGTNTFKVKYQVNNTDVDTYSVLKNETSIMNVTELKKFMSNKFSTMKSISHMYS